MELTAIINKINSFLWGVPLLILLLGGGIYLSIKLGFPQIHIIKIMKKTVFTLFKKESSESDSLSQFQTFSTALAATVGTGSVVGVGECIRIGGAGSVFWMWVSAFFGMGLAYCENYLGVRCSDGKLCGAASYLEKIGRTKLTAVLFAVFTVGASLGMGNMVQTGSAAAAAREGFGIPSYIFALVVLIFVFLVAVGKNSAACLCEKLVPIMAVLFIGGSLGDNISPIKSRRSDSNDSKKRLLPHSLHNRLGGRDDNIFHGGGVKAWSVFKRSRLRLDGGSTQLMRDKVA